MSSHEALAARAIHSNTPIYGYVPSETICAVFLALFALSTVIHLGQAVRFRMWWLIPTAVTAGITEMIGWSGRIWSSKNPTLLTPYLMQISTLGLAPTFLIASNFIILGQLITRLGRQYSRLGPMLYTVVFCCVDAIALTIQGVGGGLASAGAAQHKTPVTGGHIMLAGIAFQMASITVYALLATEFFVRYFLDKPVRRAAPAAGTPGSEAPFAKEGFPGADDAAAAHARHGLTRRERLMVGALVFSTLCIFIRSVYRVVELSNGWGGPIITNQVYFNVLDGAMIVLAMYTLNVFHPGIFLRA